MRSGGDSSDLGQAVARALAALTVAALLLAVAGAARADNDRVLSVTGVGLVRTLVVEKRILDCSKPRDVPCLKREGARLAATAKAGIRSIRASLDGSEVACARNFAQQAMRMMAFERLAGQALVRGDLKEAGRLLLRADVYNQRLPGLLRACVTPND
jgi:hypothetical protein